MGAAARVRFAVNTDAHAVPHLDHRRFGVGMAQRGWLTKDDVINAWPLSKLRSSWRTGSRDVGQAAALVLRATVDRGRAGLLGHVLVRAFPDGARAAVRIVEVEAYEPDDPASHACGETPRNAPCSTGRPPVRVLHVRHALLHERRGRGPGDGSACLRAGEPLEGLDGIRARRGRDAARDLLRSGPVRPGARLDRTDDGLDLVTGALRGSSGGPTEEIRPVRAASTRPSARGATGSREPVRVPREAGTALQGGVGGRASSGGVHAIVSSRWTSGTPPSLATAPGGSPGAVRLRRGAVHVHVEPGLGQPSIASGSINPIADGTATSAGTRGTCTSHGARCRR